MNKVLFSIIIISLLLVTLLQSVRSANEVFLDGQKDKVAGYPTHKDYFNCKIKTYEFGVDGRAFLFPGCLKAFMGGGNIKRASGILIAFEHIMGEISFNDDEYNGDWIRAYIFSFNGYFRNYMDRVWQVFNMDGTAKFARVIYYS
jgi:hypothetical protein